MKRTAERHPTSHLHVICPFCGYAVNHLPSTVTPWCGGCGVEFYMNRNNDAVFDTNRRSKTPIAKAAWRAANEQDDD